MRIRPRRNRANASVRGMVRETRLSLEQLVYPLFLLEDKHAVQPILSMPGISRFGLEKLMVEVDECMNAGVTNFILFPAVDEKYKDKYAMYSLDASNFYLTAIRELKKRFPEAVFISDVAMDPYSSDGHDGLVIDGKIVNDETLPILSAMALAQAEAGFDIIGPSDMMDGRVGEIRDTLDDHGFVNVGIMSYTAKYASAFYGPFREALDSAPKSGDKKTYQMDYANRNEALREAELDEEEGADFLMVKPALCYLDVIRDLTNYSSLPIAAYNVSGEYAMLKAAAERGWIDYNKAMPEMLTSIARSGASVILTYFAKEYAQKFHSKF
jgi:porphobilinogen synthase